VSRAVTAVPGGGPARDLRRPATPGRGLAVHRVRLAIHAPDPLSEAGLTGYVARRPDLEVLPAGRAAEADVVVVVAPLLNAALMEQLRGLSGEQPTRFLLVLDRLGDADLLSAVEVGVAAVLWRAEAGPERFVEVLLAVSRGGSELPAELQGRLLEDVARLQRTVLAPRGLTASGLDTREVDVLRFIAAGLDTSEIAQKMAYSERTVKAILYGLMSRLNLRNRSHAVAYAMRAGIL
jgi:DNA-binding NarL/FixJ family response regulator